MRLHDGWLEIAVGSLNDSVYAFNHNGSRAIGWPRGTGDDVKSTPAIADINHDGRLDVICASTDSSVYAWWGCGNPMSYRGSADGTHHWACTDHEPGVMFAAVPRLERTLPAMALSQAWKTLSEQAGDGLERWDALRGSGHHLRDEVDNHIVDLSMGGGGDWEAALLVPVRGEVVHSAREALMILLAGPSILPADRLRRARRGRRGW